MIFSTTMPPGSSALGQSFEAALAQGEGVGFLESLLGALPPELEGASPEQLIEWLHSQDQLVLPFVPTAPPTPLPAEPAMARAAEDPAALLGLMLSSRGGLPWGSGQAQPQQQVQNPEAAGALAEALLFASNGEPAAEAPPQGFQSLLQASSGIAAANAARAPIAGDVPSFTLNTPINDPAFGEAVGERLVWMVRQDVQQARIHLDPAHLGPLEISVSIKDDVASIVINAQHATTREALDADTQRLRNMLGDSGFTSVDVNVARDGGKQPDDQEPRPAPLAQFGAGMAADEEGQGEGGANLRGRGLVDHYA